MYDVFRILGRPLIRLFFLSFIYRLLICNRFTIQIRYSQIFACLSFVRIVQLLQRNTIRTISRSFLFMVLEAPWERRRPWESSYIRCSETIGIISGQAVSSFYSEVGRYIIDDEINVKSVYV